MNAPGGRSSRGLTRPVSIPEPFLSYRPGSVWLFRGGEERGEPQADPGCAFLCLRHWDLKNPFSKTDPPIQKEPQIHYLLLADIRRLLGYIKTRQQGYGSALAFHLANALFQTACRFDELIQLTWVDCQAVGKEIVALRIKGKGSVFQDVPVTGALSAALLEWRGIQEGFKARRIRSPEGSPSPDRSLCLRGIRASHFPTVRLICDCGPLAERSEWGTLPPTG